MEANSSTDRVRRAAMVQAVMVQAVMGAMGQAVSSASRQRKLCSLARCSPPAAPNRPPTVPVCGVAHGLGSPALYHEAKK